MECRTDTSTRDYFRGRRATAELRIRSGTGVRSHGIATDSIIVVGVIVILFYSSIL